VSKLVRHDAGRDTGRSTDFVQVVAQLADQGGLAFGASQKMAVGRQGVERTEETETLNELTDKRVYRDHPFCFQFAQGNMNGPMIRSDVAEAIPGKVDTFTDAHTGMAQEQKYVGRQIVAAQQFLLDHLILLCG
jgi:hypothetical protein